MRADSVCLCPAVDSKAGDGHIDSLHKIIHAFDTVSRYGSSFQAEVQELKVSATKTSALQQDIGKMASTLRKMQISMPPTMPHLWDDLGDIRDAFLALLEEKLGACHSLCKELRFESSDKKEVARICKNLDSIIQAAPMFLAASLTNSIMAMEAIVKMISGM